MLTLPAPRDGAASGAPALDAAAAVFLDFTPAFTGYRERRTGASSVTLDAVPMPPTILMPTNAPGTWHRGERVRFDPVDGPFLAAGCYLAWLPLACAFEACHVAPTSAGTLDVTTCAPSGERTRAETRGPEFVLLGRLSDLIVAEARRMIADARADGVLPTYGD